MPKRTESPDLKTKAEVVKALGGAGPISALTGSRYKNTWGWCQGDEPFPPKYFLVMSWALKQKRLTAPPALWGMVTIAEMDRMTA